MSQNTRVVVDNTLNHTGRYLLLDVSGACGRFLDKSLQHESSRERDNQGQHQNLQHCGHVRVFQSPLDPLMERDKQDG